MLYLASTLLVFGLSLIHRECHFAALIFRSINLTCIYSSDRNVGTDLCCSVCAGF